ncbi:MAG TPA: nitroreductase family protein [Anaerolineae bacterium]|nr:nitroreductase family protein [Anaerolineae bacterium]
MTPQQLTNWLQSRRSIRRYQPTPIPQTLLEQLLTTANWAPSAHNRQPWRWAVLTQPQHKHQLATAMGQRLTQDLTTDNLDPALIAKDVNRSYQRLTQAPALVIVCLTMADMDTYPDPRRQAHEHHMAVQSTAMAGQNLLLAAHALGLGACWLCAPLFCPQTVRHTLNLPSDWEPQGLITLGYPAQTRTKTRHPLHTRARFL